MVSRNTHKQTDTKGFEVVCRHEMYPGYKGQRPPTPEPITEAVKKLRDLIRVMGIQEIIVPGIEADDVIGTVANNALKEGLKVAVASPDKVGATPSNSHCSLINPKS